MRGKPAVPACLAFAAGVVIARYALEGVVTAHNLLFALLACLLAVGMLAMLKRSGAVVGYGLMAGLLAAGALRYLLAAGASTDRMHIVHIARPEGQDAVVRGVAISAPDQRPDHALVTLRASEVGLPHGTVRVRGKVLLRLRTSFCPIRYGDLLEVEGVLMLPPAQRNPGGFDYREYLRAQGIHAILRCRDLESVHFLGSGSASWLLRSLVYPVRERIVWTVERSFGGDQRAFLKGLLVGARGEIRPELRQAFANTGVVHVLAVSGLHVGFVALIAMALVRVAPIPAAVRPLVVCAVLVLFALITEARPPVVRATIMACALLLSTSLRRVTNVYNTLAVAGLVVLWVNPFELFQAGFQLSFAAVLSIVSLYRRLQQALRTPLLRALQRNSFFGTAVAPLLFVSMAAQLGTLPLTAYYFGLVPLVSLVANMLVVPTVGLIVALGYTTVLIGLLCWPMAKFYAAANWLVLTVLLRGVEWLGNLPFAFVPYHQPRFLHAVAYYGLLACGLHLREARWRGRALLLGLAVACCAVWAQALRPRGLLEAAVLDVGQGDSAFIRFPNGTCVLVDAGPADSTMSAGRTFVEPFLRSQGVHGLDALVVTHPHSDHYGGATHLLRSLRVDRLYAPAQEDTTLSYLETLRVADSVGVRPHRVLAGAEISSDSSALLLVLHPTPRFVGPCAAPPYGMNNTSLVLLLIYGRTRLLLMGDAEIPAEEALLRYGSLLQSPIVKVGHHGSSLSSGSQFLEAVRAEVALVSVGAGNPYRLPARSALERIHRSGAKVLRTDHEGAIVFRSDGRRWQQVKWRRKLPSLLELLSW